MAWSSLKSGTFQRLQTSYGLVLLGAVLGAAGGLVLFVVALLEGWHRSTTIGAIIGVVGAIALSLLLKWRARFALTKVSVSVPFLREVEFMVNSHYKLAAWRLFVETMTRVATQPLASNEGHVREALQSLYNLFQTTRDLLKEIEPTPTTEGWTVELLALQMLNAHIRPFLAYWHPRVPENSKEQGSTELDETKCREELQDLRNRLVEYARAFGELAGVQQLDHFFTNEQPPSQ